MGTDEADEGKTGEGEERWSRRRLRDDLAARGVVLRSPAEHRDRWLEGLMTESVSAFVLGSKRQGEVSADFLQSALDAAAGVLLELPRMEEEAWRGWDDPRFCRVLAVLRMAELPKEPPRVALRPAWAQLRAAVPFELSAPRAGDPAHSLGPLREVVRGYVADLELEVERVPEVDPDEFERPADAEGAPAIPAHLLHRRLSNAVGRHTSRVQQWVVPLADDLYWECFAAQRSGASLARRRGDAERHAEGRRLRRRKKLRYHLAAWILKEAGLSRVDIGLFWHHVDPSGLQAAPPAVPAEGWKEQLEKEVDNSLAYWTSGHGARGNRPSVHLGHIEWELRDLLRPLRS